VIICPTDAHLPWRILREDVTEGSDLHSLFVQLSCAKAEELTTAVLVKREDQEHGCSLMADLSSGEGYVADVLEDDILHIFNTSGSTGFSKLVPRPNRYIFEVNPFELQTLTYYTNAPMGWVGGYAQHPYQNEKSVKKLLLDLFKPLINPEGVPALTWKILKQESGKLLVGPVKLAYDILEQVGDIHPDDRLEHFYTLGQPVMQHQVAGMLKLAKSVTVGYGGTEILIVARTQYITDSKNYKDFCVGKPICSQNLRIVNNKLEDCKPGETGSIWLKGDNIPTGYFTPRSPENTRPKHVFLENGWFNTQDCGFLDESGDLFVVGREGDAIMYGAYIIYPGWVESKMAAIRGISDVVIVPVSDPVMFHEVCACVKLGKDVVLTEDQLRKEAGDLLSKESNSLCVPVPKYFLILEDMPMGKTLKIDRKRIKEMAEEKFGKK